MKKSKISHFRKGYLVLKRKEKQGFKIGEDIEIYVSKASDGVAEIAIKAIGMKVLRNEIADKPPRQKSEKEKENSFDAANKNRQDNFD